MKYVFFIPVLHQLTTDSTKDLVAICSNILGYWLKPTGMTQRATSDILAQLQTDFYVLWA